MTDAALDKAACARVARMASGGVARAVDPVHSDVDGDVVFCLSSGRGAADRFTPIAVGDDRRHRHRRGDPRLGSAAVAVRLAGHLSDMPGAYKTEAVVLRSIRYGEADRVLHLYSATRGRVSAIAKGSRRPRSRFGGRLEPFFRLDLVLYEGRGELATVTAAHTVAAHPSLRSSEPALMAAARGCDAVLRLLDSAEANPPAYNLLCRYLALLDGEESARGDRARDGAAGLSTALAFRLKLALAAGFSPELASCARCGEADGSGGLLGRRRRASSAPRASGAVSSSRRRPTASWSRRWVARWPPRRAPRSARCARSSARSRTTLEHHAHVHLRAAA